MDDDDTRVSMIGSGNKGMEVSLHNNPASPSKGLSTSWRDDAKIDFNQGIIY